MNINVIYRKLAHFLSTKFDIFCVNKRKNPGGKHDTLRLIIHLHCPEFTSLLAWRSCLERSASNPWDIMTAIVRAPLVPGKFYYYYFFFFFFFKIETLNFVSCQEFEQRLVTYPKTFVTHASNDIVLFKQLNDNNWHSITWGYLVNIVNLNGSQLTKMKKSIPDMSLPWNLNRDEAVGLKSCKYT